MDENYKKYLKVTLKQSSFTFLIRLFSYLLSFLLQALFAKFLGSNDYGLYLLGLNITSIAVMFTTLGTPTSMQKFLGKYLGKNDIQKTKSIINATFTIVSITTIIAFLILNLNKHFFAIKIFKKPKLEIYLFYFSILLILYSYIYLFKGLFRGIKKPAKFTFQKEFFERLLRIVVFILLFFIGYKLSGAILATIISNLIILIVLFTQFKKTQLIDLSVSPIFSEILAVFKFSIYMFFTNFTYFLISQVNITISGLYLDSSQIAIYGISNTLAMFNIFFLNSINSVFGTIISELFHTNKFDTLKNLYTIIIRITITLTIPLTIWMNIYSKEILNFFGKEYINGYMVLILLSLGQFVNAISGPNSLMLSMTKYQKIELTNGIIIAFLNIFLNLLLIPKYGIVGSAIGGTIAIISINILKSFELYFFLKLQPYTKKLIKPIISGVILIVILFIIKNFYNSYNMFFVGIMLINSYIIYILIMTLLKWNKEDLEFLNVFLKKLKSKK